MAKCSLCNFPIVFVRMASGKQMPCDPGPDSNGNVAALKSAGRLHGGRIITPAAPVLAGEMQLMAHFATCPERHKETRKPRPVKAPEPQADRLF